VPSDELLANERQTRGSRDRVAHSIEEALKPANALEMRDAIDFAIEQRIEALGRKRRRSFSIPVSMSEMLVDSRGSKKPLARPNATQVLF
jgi:hypothetical protein